MYRALTIRFALMCLGAAPLVAFLNHVDAAAGLAGSALIFYTLGASYLFARYCIAHQDEIPVRSRREDHRR